MKIALVSPYDWSVPGGVNSHCAHLRSQFIQRGHEVRIIAPSSKDVGDRGVTTIGTRPVTLPVAGSVARISLSLTLAGPVRKLLAGEHFDVVHVHEPFMPVLPIHFLRYSDAVNVGTFHASRSDDQFFYYSWSKRHLRRWIRRLDGKIAVSPAATRFVEKYFPGYYNIIPNGVNVARFANAKPLDGYDDGKLNILFVGRPEKRKGLDHLLQAFALVRKKRKDVRLIVVGGGKFDRYKRTARTLRLEDVDFVGYVSDEELPRYHQSADIFCAPNTGFESQGIVLLEAMAAGLPLVASNIEGFASVLTHGVHGLLVLPGDEHALAGSLLEMMDDKEGRRRMGDQGRAHAEDYSWDRVSQQVLSYYERLRYERSSANASAPERAV